MTPQLFIGRYVGGENEKGYEVGKIYTLTISARADIVCVTNWGHINPTYYELPNFFTNWEDIKPLIDEKQKG